MYTLTNKEANMNAHQIFLLWFRDDYFLACLSGETEWLHFDTFARLSPK